MPGLSDDTLQYLRASPFFAATEGRDKTSQDLFYAKFEKLSDAFRQFLLAPETADDISYIVTTNKLDDRYLTALGKIVASVTMGEVPVSVVQQLLEKLDLPTEQAAQIADGIAKLVEPVLVAKAQAVVGPKPKEIPPLSRTVGGIIDLRNQGQKNP